MSQDLSLDLIQYLRMFWRRRGVVILAAVTVVCTSVVGIQFLPAEYETAATLRLEERRPLSSELERVIGASNSRVGAYRADEAQLDEMRARISSRPFLERVARLLKMNEDPRVLETARKALRTYPDATVDELAIRHVVNQLRNKISFRGAGMSNYKIVVADSDPKHAQLLAQWISEMFVDYSLQSSLQELRTAHEFGAEQERIYEERLRLSELALEQSRQAAIQTDLSQGFVRDQNLSRAEALYTQMLDEVDLARLRLLPLSRSIEEAGLSGAADLVEGDSQVQNPVLALRTELREHATEIAAASGSPSGPQWPPQEGYLVVRRGILRLIERRTDALHGERSVELRDLIARYVFAKIDYDEQSDIAAYLGQEIAEFKLQAQATPRDEMELSRLEADVESNRSLLSSFRSQLIASDINQAMQITSLGIKVEVLDPPQFPLRPVRPDKPKLLMAALVMGPLLGLAIAFVTELVDPTLRTLADFRRISSVPVIGTAPLVEGKSVRKGGLAGHWKAVAVTCVLLLTVLFFLTQATLLPDLTIVNPSIEVVDPGSEMSP